MAATRSSPKTHENDESLEQWHPRTSRPFHGHGAIVGRLTQSIHNNKLAHGHVFVGETGIGKRTLAFHVARAVLSPDLERQNGLFIAPHTKTSQLIAAQSHPDLLVMGDDDAANLTIDTTRHITRFAQSTAALGGWRVVIMPRMGRLTTQAANALLKTLEEPTPRLLLLFTAEQLGQVLPTLRSRLQVHTMQRLAQAELQAVLKDLDCEPMDNEHSLAANGSVQKALMLQQSEGLLSFFDHWFAHLKTKALDTESLAFADKFANLSPRSYTLFQELLLRRLRDLALQAEGWQKQVAWSELAEQALSEWRTTAEYNLDKKAYFIKLSQLIREKN